MSYQLTPEMLIDQARKMTGLDDFGADTWMPGLAALVRSLNTDVAPSEGCFNYFFTVLSQVLANRLEVQALVARHPEITKQAIKHPLIITGLPRTGTTIAHTLLALDPCARFIRNWESAMNICPPPGLMPRDIDPRAQAYHAGMEGLFSAMPGLRGINGVNFMAHGTAECQNLTAHEFAHFGYAAGSSLFSYGDYLSDCDYKPVYRYHKLLLQVLQWKTPNERWVLKAPMHLFGLKALLGVYPDARIIFTHRDPLSAVSSGISMVEQWTRFTTGTANRRAIVNWWIRVWSHGLKQAMDIRQHLGPNRVYDLFHEELPRSPAETVKNIHTHFNIPFLRSHSQRIRAWLADNTRPSFGSHDHRLTADEQKQASTAFAFYNAWLKAHHSSDSSGL
ncbi:MAG: sulfotransferase [Desulfobacter sp.]